MACSACQWSGLPTMTTSRLRGFNISRKSTCVAGACCFQVPTNSSRVAASMFASGSDTDTTSTSRLPAVTMSKLRKFTMPYHPQPIRPTRSFLTPSAFGAASAVAARALAALAARNMRRSICHPERW